MSVRAEIERLIRDKVVIRNLEQLSRTLRFVVLETKDDIKRQFGYEPKIGECLHLIYTGKTVPDKCLLSGCEHNGVFRGQIQLGDDGYRYCCKEHSDKDPIRNANIQAKRMPKIDYDEVHKKVVKTKNESIDENGLNIHQQIGAKTKKSRNENYEYWYKNMCDAQSKITKELRQERSKARQSTIERKYGVTHFGGGISKIKKIEIKGKIFTLQGYEDITIFKLVESGYNVNDIESVSQQKTHRIEYSFNGEGHAYYPDIFIKSENRYIEVKSDYWYNKEKLKTDTKILAAQMNGLNIELIVYGKGDKNEIQRIRKIIKRAE